MDLLWRRKIGTTACLWRPTQGVMQNQVHRIEELWHMGGFCGFKYRHSRGGMWFGLAIQQLVEDHGHVIDLFWTPCSRSFDAQRLGPKVHMSFENSYALFTVLREKGLPDHSWVTVQLDASDATWECVQNRLCTHAFWMQKPKVVSLCFLWRLTFDQNHRSWHISRCSISGAEKQLQTDDELVSACFGHFGPASLKVYDLDFFSTGTCPFFSTLSGMIWIVQSIFPWLLQSVEYFETKKRPGLPSENSNLQRCIILHSRQSYGFVPVLDDPCGKVLASPRFMGDDSMTWLDLATLLRIAGLQLH